LTLDANTGTLSGTPAAVGNFSFTVQAVDANQLTATKSFALAIKAPPLVITTVAPLFNGTVGLPYSQTFSATGGIPPYRWTVSSGQTDGLTMDPIAGTLKGTPQAAGTFSFGVAVTDSAGTVTSSTFSILISSPSITITTTTLPNGTVGAAYSQTLSAAGGTAPYTWGLLSGSVPGLKLDPGGALSGTPATAGVFALSLQATDSNGLTASKTFTLTVTPAALVVNGPLQNQASTAGVPFSQSMSASGGSPPYLWTATGLPDGLSLDSASGTIAGTPATPGSYAVTIRVTDNAQATAAAQFQIQVNMPAQPQLTISGLAATVLPASQPAIGVQLNSAYPGIISGTLTLSFVPDAGNGDATIQFSTGGRSVGFTIAQGSTNATFPIPSLAIQTGTVAGTIALTAQLQAFGTDVTPTPAPSSSGRVAPAAPVITSATVVQSATGFQVAITGFSTAQEMTQATFQFSTTGATPLQSTQITLQLSDLFNAWFQGSTSAAFGSQFTYTQPFTVQGDATAVTVDSVTLTNRQGSAVYNLTP
jgi:hypothetical protein